MQEPGLFLHRTRLAPTPSGYLHLGNLYSFFCTQKLAAKHDASILLRIDDLDQQRTSEKYVDDIFETLSFFDIQYQLGPRNAREFRDRFSQMQRINLYAAALQTLASRNLVFACDCSRAQTHHRNRNGSYPGTCLHRNIPLDRPGVSWRLRTDNAPVHIKTLHGQDTQAFPAGMQYFVVKRNDGIPAYQLSSLVDDLHYNIDLVVRGEDLFDSTLAQLTLARYLDEHRFLETTFHHHPLIKADNGQKLSKSAGDTSIQYLRRQGRTAREILDMLPI